MNTTMNNSPEQNGNQDLANQIQTLQSYIDESSRIVFFGGAGVSTESGIPDFRSVDGLYHQKWDYPPEEILSSGFFHSNPKEFYRFYREKILVPNILPNSAHKKLAELESAKKLTAVVTQNIDGLHQSGGSKCVWELHGSVLRNHCTKCGKFFDLDYINTHEDSQGIPRCDSCSSIIKPDVVLYGEGLEDSTVDGAINSIASADLLIIGGTSLTVYPAAGFIRYFRGKHIVLINRDQTDADQLADLVIHHSIGQVLSAIKIC